MGRRRGDAKLDPSLARLAEQIGANKLAPDVTAQEKHYSRSLKIRLLILEYLMENDGTTWANEMELHARAALYASCSSVTAARWVFQWTRVGAPMELIPAVGHWLLARRGNAGKDARRVAEDRV